MFISQDTIVEVPLNMSLPDFDNSKRFAIQQAAMVALYTTASVMEMDKLVKILLCKLPRIKNTGKYEEIFNSPIENGSYRVLTKIIQQEY